jgi:hypothetical protein
VGGHTLIFLFNFSDRLLHGVHRATSNGQENLSFTAWRGSAPVPKVGGRADGKAEAVGEMGEDGGELGSPFPAQCTFEAVEEFAPAPEAEFRHGALGGRFFTWPGPHTLTPALASAPSHALAPTLAPVRSPTLLLALSPTAVLEYTERQRFKFKLSHWQCRDLIEALSRHDAKLRARRICAELHLNGAKLNPPTNPNRN